MKITSKRAEYKLIVLEEVIKENRWNGFKAIHGARGRNMNYLVFESQELLSLYNLSDKCQ